MSFKDYLNEMPYVEINNQITDLELEKIKSKSQFVSYLKYFFSLSHKTITDKYGEKIEFKNSKERNAIKDEIFNHIDVQNFIARIEMKQSELKSVLKKM